MASAIRSTVLAVLLVAAGLWLLPRSCTGRLGGLAQVLLPFQDAATTAVDAVAGDSGERTGPVPYPVFAEADRARQAAEHRAAALALRVRQLEDEVKLLTASRHWDALGPRIGARGQLIPARVVADDLLPWRSSRLLSPGRSRGASAGDPVLSREFTVDKGEKDGARDGFAIITGEVLLGFVDRASSNSARVRLLTDPESGTRVRVGRVTEGVFDGPDRYHWLMGRSGGRMEIRDAEVDDIEAGRIRIGDLVLSDPQNELLPAAMLIGRVTDIEENPENPLFATLIVESPVDETSLRRVYVYDPGWDEEPP